MLHRTFALYITFHLVLAIDLETASEDESTSNTNRTDDQTPSEDITSLIKNAMNDANSTNASQSLLELVELATANQTNDYNNKKPPTRRFLHWFKGVLSNFTTSTPTPFYTTRSLVYSTPKLVYNTPNWDYTTPNWVYTTPNPGYRQAPQMKSIDDEKLAQSYLISVLMNLTEVLEKLNRNIEEQISLDPLTVQPLRLKGRSGRRGKRETPIDGSIRRNKREAPKDGHELKAANGTNFTASTAPPLKAITLTPPPNPSSTSLDGLEDPNLCAPENTRRSDWNTNSPVKEKLLKYLNDTFQEIETKIQPVQGIKINYASEGLFRIGYVVANIDTLEVSLLNLKADMDLHGSLWEDKKILDLFDKIMVTNKVVSNLIESLYELHDKKKGSQRHYKLH